MVDLNQLCEDGDMDKFIREGQNTYGGRGYVVRPAVSWPDSNWPSRQRAVVFDTSCAGAGIIEHISI